MRLRITRSLDVVRLPEFLPILTCGFLWGLAQWMALFLGPFLLIRHTGSPFLAQVAGVMFFLPMLLVSLPIGSLTDRMDNSLLCRLVLGASIVLTFAFMVASVSFGRDEPWVIYSAMFVIGLGAVFNQVTRRTLMFGIIPGELSTTAMALDALAQFVAAALGPLMAAAAVTAFDGPGGFGAILLALLCALIALSCVSSQLGLILFAGDFRPGQNVVAESIGASAPSAVSKYHFAGDATNSGLRSVVGVTVVMNVFLFSYVPLMPVLALALNAGTLMAGLFTAAQGVGMTIGGLALLVLATERRGKVYVYSSMVALLGMTALGVVRTPALGLAIIVCIGVTSAGFGMMQTVLVLSVAQPGEQGRALGQLSIAIGALPLGGLQIGIVADVIGVSSALVVEGCAGTGCLLLWLVRNSQVLRL